MSTMDHSTVRWRKSSRSSAQGGNCVEVTELRGRIAIRDSKNPTGPILTFGGATRWNAPSPVASGCWPE